ncbi:MAG: hypothetical protein ACOY82_00405 [Pseudomonadota bacterium]
MTPSAYAPYKITGKAVRRMARAEPPKAMTRFAVESPPRRCRDDRWRKPLRGFRPTKTTGAGGFDLDLTGPLVAAGFADRARRARDRKSRVFRQYRDVLSKNPVKPADPARSAGRNRRGVLSFGDLFFAQAKKSHSLAVASEIKDREESADDGCR